MINVIQWLIFNLSQCRAAAVRSAYLLVMWCLYRDRDISREHSLRMAAEQRLDKLVDMYGNPAVNQELNDRLPRAKLSNNVDSWRQQHHTKCVSGQLLL